MAPNDVVFSRDAQRPFSCWVAYPNEMAFVHDDDNETYHNRGGWWRTPWRGTEADVLALGRTPIHTVKAKSKT